MLRCYVFSILYYNCENWVFEQLEKCSNTFKYQKSEGNVIFKLLKSEQKGDQSADSKINRSKLRWDITPQNYEGK